jgi:predicted small metal-binding protein
MVIINFMKVLECHDIDSSSSDNFKAQGTNEDEVIKDMMEHFKSIHPEKIVEMSKAMTEKEMMDLMKLKMKNEAKQ